MGKKKLFEEIPCLEGERLTLRKLSENDKAGSAEVYRWFL